MPITRAARANRTLLLNKLNLHMVLLLVNFCFQFAFRKLVQ